jgi:DNA repair protein RadC
MEDERGEQHNGPLAPPRPEAAARPRETLRARGCDGLGDGELIALVVGSGCAGRSALKIGRWLARRHSLGQLADWTPERWARVRGLGEARAASLVAAFELGRRTFERAGEAVGIHGPEDVAAQVRELRRARREHFVALLLNARNELLRREVVSIGSLNASIVHPREVLPRAQRGGPGHHAAPGAGRGAHGHSRARSRDRGEPGRGELQGAPAAVRGGHGFRRLRGVLAHG